MAIPATRIYVENVGTVTMQLRELDKKVRRKTLKNATRAAGKVILNKVRTVAPKKTGFFRRSIVLTVRSRGDVVTARVGQKKDYRAKKLGTGSNINKKGYAAPIWFLEYGTGQHTIKPSAGKKALAWQRGQLAGEAGQKRVTKQIRTLRKSLSGLSVVRRIVKHPGTKARAVLAEGRQLAQRSAAAAWYAEIRKELVNLPALPSPDEPQS